MQIFAVTFSSISGMYFRIGRVALSWESKTEIWTTEGREIVDRFSETFEIFVNETLKFLQNRDGCSEQAQNWYAS